MPPKRRGRPACAVLFFILFIFASELPGSAGILPARVMQRPAGMQRRPPHFGKIKYLDNLHRMFTIQEASLGKSAVCGVVAAWGVYENAFLLVSLLFCRSCVQDAEVPADLQSFSRLHHLHPIFQSRSLPLRCLFLKGQQALP